MNKEEIFDLIDEYMKLKNTRYTIKLKDRKIREKAFGILMNSEDVFGSFEKETYTISGIQKRRLDKAKVKYEVIK